MAFKRRQASRMPPALVGALFLPDGLSQGFISVTLGYVLAQQGVSVSAIAGIVGLRMLPTTWSVLAGPLIDSTLSLAGWYTLSVIAVAVCLPLVGAASTQDFQPWLIGSLALVLGITAVISASAADAIVAVSTENDVRGSCAGWRQTGVFAGLGLGGGAGLWLATHAGGIEVAALALALTSLLCLSPLLLVAIPHARRHTGFVDEIREAVGAVAMLVRSRRGILALIAVILPAGLGVAAYILPSAAGHWHVSVDFVAAVTGVLSGIASIPGCIGAGLLCDRFPRRTVFMACCLVAAFGEAAMAFGPPTPAGFAVLVLLGAVLTGLAYGSMTAMIYDILGPSGAATVSSTLFSLSNIPVVAVLLLIGAVQAEYGVVAMLLVEAGLGVLSIGIYALILRLVRD